MALLLVDNFQLVFAIGAVLGAALLVWWLVDRIRRARGHGGRRY
jgi:flagellar biogenesis protein FliO